jgi:hypothetical protein
MHGGGMQPGPAPPPGRKQLGTYCQPGRHAPPSSSGSQTMGPPQLGSTQSSFGMHIAAPQLLDASGRASALSEVVSIAASESPPSALPPPVPPCPAAPPTADPAAPAPEAPAAPLDPAVPLPPAPDEPAVTFPPCPAEPASPTPPPVPATSCASPEHESGHAIAPVMRRAQPGARLRGTLSLWRARRSCVARTPKRVDRTARCQRPAAITCGLGTAKIFATPRGSAQYETSAQVLELVANEAFREGIALVRLTA